MASFLLLFAPFAYGHVAWLLPVAFLHFVKTARALGTDGGGVGRELAPAVCSKEPALRQSRRNNDLLLFGEHSIWQQHTLRFYYLQQNTDVGYFFMQTVGVYTLNKHSRNQHICTLFTY